MNTPRSHRSLWHAGPASLGPAIITALGCALPLALGLATAHSGFLWAAIGALQASQANALNRFGMLRMLLLTSLGAITAGLGFWAAQDPLLSLGLFALFGLLLAWLQRYGAEAGKLGIGLAISLCLGQGQLGAGSLHNPSAVAVLFAVGGLWVMLLAFALRGLHGLRMWPYMPRFISLFKVLRRYAERQPPKQWRQHALACTLAFAFAALIVNLAGLPRGYWLTLAVISTLQLGFNRSLARTLLISLTTLLAACALIALGYSLQQPSSLVLIALFVITCSRALQANLYSLYAVQTSLGFMLLAESLATDWSQSEMRVLNVLLGTVLGLTASLLLYVWQVRRAQSLRMAKRQNSGQ